MNYTVYSFDVFDTVITRVIGSPEVAFLLLGKQLARLELIDCTAESFARLRASAERRAISNLGPGITLADIYGELELPLRMLDGQKARLIHQEQQLQAELIRPVPLIQEHIRKLRQQGKHIIFVSDMHLPTDFIRQQLAVNDLWKPGDQCYVSCDFGKSKSSGNLFAEILQLEEISPVEICHLGNDARADVEGPEALGISAELFEQGNLNRYEAILDSHAWDTEGFSSVMAGASRLARLFVPASSDGEIAIRDVTAGVVAPLLVSYVLWLLQRAQDLNLKKLYFLSRDGQILLDIARQLAKPVQFQGELCYLYGSRLAWNQAFIQSFDEWWIWSPLSEFCSLEFLCSRLDIEEHEISHSLREFGLGEVDWRRALDPQEVNLARKALESEPIKSLIVRKAERKARDVITYLEQQGVFDSSDIGIVDLGWAGSMYSALSRLLHDRGQEQIVGLYFAKNKHPELDVHCDRLEAYFFDERTSQGIVDNRIKDALELFCSADHGTVVGFHQNLNGLVSPTLDPAVDQKVIDWGLPILRDTLGAFIANLPLDSDLVGRFADTRQATAEAFDAFWSTPSASEARVWGAFPWEDHLPRTGSEPLTWAMSYTWSHILEAFREGSYPRQHSRTWIRGSLLGSPALVRKLMRIAIILKTEGLVGLGMALRRFIHRVSER